MNKIIIISGATASGKSLFASELATLLDTEIISCDSMQIYKGMDIGTAKATLSERAKIQQHMLDVISPFDEFSVSEYAEQAKKIISKLHLMNKVPIIAGGTGLYIDAILYPLTFSNDKNVEVRQRLAEELKVNGVEYMHKKLQNIDPLEAEKIHANNTKRVLRALEIYEITGEIKSNITERSDSLNYETCFVALNPPREFLYESINTRVEKMFENGLENEVDTLLKSGLTFDAQAMQAIGYKEFQDYFAKKIDIEQVKYLIKLNSRHYAKRQLSWLRRYDFVKYFDPLTEKENAQKYILDFVNN